MDFLFGFLCCWVAVGLYAIAGLVFEWPERLWFWEVLCLPLMPIVWLWDKLRRS